MLKPLSLSVSLAVAFGACSLSFAGGHGKSMPSPQGEIIPSAQSVVPSGQSIADGCGDACGPVKKKCDFFSKFKPKPACYTYEWVLKKKKVHNWSLFGHKNTGGCGEAACDSCGTTPSGQSYGSGQTLGSGQGYGSGQTWAATQVPASYSAPQAGGLMPAPAGADVEPPKEKTDAAPADKAPEVKPTASNGGLQLLPAGH